MRILAILLGVALLAACSGTPTQTQYYLLRTDEPGTTRDLKPSTEFAMGRVMVAPYVDQSGLILETAAGEIHPARYHQWAEPMPEALRHLLRVEVGRALQTDLFPSEISDARTFFDVRIDQLHGTADGKAVLVAYWGVRRDGKLIETFQFSASRALGEDGYAELARTFEALLVDLSGEIAESLRAASAAEG